MTSERVKLTMRLRDTTKKALIFIRTVSAVRKGLELALSRGEIVIRKPPVKHSLDIPSGEEVEGSALWDRLKTKKALIFIRTVSAVRKGLEPSTSGVTGRRSNQAELPHQ